MDRSVTVPIGVTHKDFVFLEKTITLSEQYGRWMVLHPNALIVYDEPSNHVEISLFSIS